MRDGQGPHAPGHDVLQPGGDDEAHLGALQAAHEGDQVLGDDRADRHDGVDALGVQGLGDVLGAAHGLSGVEGAVLPGGQVAHDEEAVHGVAAQLGEHGLGARAHDDEGATQGVPLEAAAAQPPGLDGASGDGQEELGRQGGQQGGPGNSGQVGQQQGHRDAHGGRGDEAARTGAGLLDGVDTEGSQEPGDEHHRDAHGGRGPDQWQVAAQEGEPEGDRDGEEVGQDEPDDEVMARACPRTARSGGGGGVGCCCRGTPVLLALGQCQGRTRQGGLRRDDRGWAITGRLVLTGRREQQRFRMLLSLADVICGKWPRSQGQDEESRCF